MGVSMRKLFVLIALLCFTTAFAQTKANDVLGYYMNPSGEAILKIYETTGKYAGKLVWMKNPEKLDTKNPDKTKQSQKILGSAIMHDFVFDGEIWKDGSIYDPKNGKTYDCKISRDEKGNLSIRGFIGISLLGRTDYFVKVNFKE
jgi:uncharacterized protein (DUF2147 family)